MSPTTPEVDAPSAALAAAARSKLLDALEGALVGLPQALAAWEGGSAATGRADALSDLDLVVLAADGSSAAVLAAMERALAPFGPFVGSYAVPEPAWHGGSQRFWQLAQLGPDLMVDVVVLERGAAERFLEPERHGRARVLFDRADHCAVPAFDAVAHARALHRAFEDAVSRFDLFQSLVAKEIRRGRLLDALGFYQGLTLRPLVQVLGMHHRPFTWDFGLRYLHHDLPAELAERLTALHLVADLRDLADKHPRAVAWFHALAASPPPDAETLAARSGELRQAG